MPEYRSPMAPEDSSSVAGKRNPEFCFPLLAGLSWLIFGSREGFFAFLLATIPGVILVSAGGAGLLWPGDRRIHRFAALGAVVSGLIAILELPLMGLGPVLISGFLSACSFVSAGIVSLRGMSLPPGIPLQPPSLRLASKVAIDEALVGASSPFLVQPSPNKDKLRRVGRELDATLEFFETRGWFQMPADYHRQPPNLKKPRIVIRRFPTKRFPGGIDYEHVSFPSEYEPWKREQGRERWLDFRKNREAHAWVLRHPKPDRPWLVCIHGTGMGNPFLDIGAFYSLLSFEPQVFHVGLGLNLLFPVLPLHGPRRTSWIGGHPALGGNVINTIHLMAQAMWDIRRLVSWIRAQGGDLVGIIGISLGGYTAALLSALEPGFACVIAGIPITDFAGSLFYTHATEADRLAFKSVDITEERMRRALRVVSPLALESQVPADRRAIFGGVADCIVPPDQVNALISHWGNPRTHWYRGGHMTTCMPEPGVRTLVRSTLEEANFLG